eukprot:scaffold1477_cov136-Pinguiococcus_pyrenoidosus.AAC.2
MPQPSQLPPDKRGPRGSADSAAAPVAVRCSVDRDAASLARHSIAAVALLAPSADRDAARLARHSSSGSLFLPLNRAWIDSAMVKGRRNGVQGRTCSTSRS